MRNTDLMMVLCLVHVFCVFKGFHYFTYTNLTCFSLYILIIALGWLYVFPVSGVIDQRVRFVTVPRATTSTPIMRCLLLSAAIRQHEQYSASTINFWFSAFLSFNTYLTCVYHLDLAALYA